jgi:NAD(P)-dependent dehydrogenase (short-subunit alcohol dehydrogenase family)
MLKQNRRRVVVITGASAGVGRATVRAFAARGFDVGLLARGVDGLEGARREVEACGRRALAVPTDMAHAAQVEAAADSIERELGPIDVWVNNAMVSVFSPVAELRPEEIERVTDVTSHWSSPEARWCGGSRGLFGRASIRSAPPSRYWRPLG